MTLNNAAYEIGLESNKYAVTMVVLSKAKFVKKNYVFNLQSSFFVYEPIAGNPSMVLREGEPV